MINRILLRYSYLVRAFFSFILLLGVTAIYFNGTRFHHADSHLSDVTYRGPVLDSSFNRLLFGNDGLGGFVQKYYALDREYETKRNFGLLDSYSERQYQSQFSHLGKDAYGATQAYQLSFWSSAVSKSLKDEAYVKALRTPAIILITAAAIYTGKQIEQKVDDDLTVRSKTEIKNSQFMGEMAGVDTSLVSGSLTYTARSAKQTEDDYKAGLVKKIEPLSASAGASYATYGQARTLMVSKNLSDHLTLNYDTTQSQKKPSGHTLGLGFSADF